MKWIIDTDPGIDDAAAIITSLRQGLDVIGISVVHGNTPIQCTLTNALRLKDILKSPIPVYKGAERGLLEPPRNAAEVHGRDGFGDIQWPQVMSNPEAQHAVDFIVEASYQQEGNLSILAIGPLTNVALAIAKDRTITERIKQLVIMGGTSRAQGNTTIVGEFNFIADPEAAAIVFESGIPITLIPWETTLETLIPLEKLQGSPRIPVADKFLEMIKPLVDVIEAKAGLKGLVLCDLVAAAVALEPEIILEQVHVFAAIETAGVYGRGLCAIDYPGLSGKPANIHVVLKVDVARMTTMFREALIAKDI